MLRQLLTFSVTFLLSLIATPLLANDTSTTQTETQTPPTQTLPKADRNDTVRAIGIEFVNGIIEYANNNLRAKIDLEWDLLPSDDSLTKTVRKYGAKIATIEIPNEYLGEDQKWQEAIQEVDDQEQRELLKRALPTPENNAKFAATWSQGQNSNWRSWLTTSVRSSEYFSLLRDRNIIDAILNKSKGVRFSFEIPSIQNNKFIDEGITWQINVYEFCQNEGCEVAYYRYTIKAKTDTFEVLVPQTSVEVLEEAKDGNPDMKGVRVKAGADLVRSPQLSGLLDDARSISIDTGITAFLPPPRENFLKQLQQENAANELEGWLAFVGGSSEFGKVISNGILGGTENASIISGGLIDFGGDEIVPLVGINQEFSPLRDASPGILFGLGLDESSLYIGPSLRFSVFTLSAGANIVDENDSLKVNGSGLISVDLSRTFGNKTDVRTLPLQDSKLGGDWYKASNEFAKDLTLAEWKLQESSDKEFKLRQVCNASGEFISDPNEQGILTVKAERQLKFIPRGYYKIEDIPVGFELYAGGSGVSAPVTENLLTWREDKFESISWELRKKDSSKRNNEFISIANNKEIDQQLCPNVVEPDSQNAVEESQ